MEYNEGNFASRRGKTRMSVRSGKTIFVCQNCGHQVSKWLGRCPQCSAWNSLAEELSAGGPAAGEIAVLLVKATRARKVLELGTSHGFSAIWMGLGLEETGGRLTTVEIDRERYDLARKHVGEAGLSQRVTCIQGDAHVEW